MRYRTPEDITYPHVRDKLIAAHVHQGIVLLKEVFPEGQVQAALLDNSVQEWSNGGYLIGSRHYKRSQDDKRPHGYTSIESASVPWSPPSTEDNPEGISLIFKATIANISDTDIDQTLRRAANKRMRPFKVDEELRKTIEERDSGPNHKPKIVFSVETQNPNKTTIAAVVFMWERDMQFATTIGKIGRKQKQLEISPPVPLLDLVLMRRRVLVMAGSP